MEIYKRTILSLIAILVANHISALTLYDLLKSIAPFNSNIEELLKDKNIKERAKGHFNISSKEDTLMVAVTNGSFIDIWTSRDSINLMHTETGFIDARTWRIQMQIENAEIRKSEMDFVGFEMTEPLFFFPDKNEKMLFLNWDLDSIEILNSYTPIVLFYKPPKLDYSTKVFRFTVKDNKYDVQFYKFTDYRIMFQDGRDMLSLPPQSLSAEQQQERLRIKEQNLKRNPSYWRPIYNHTSDLIEKSYFDIKKKPQKVEKTNKRKFKY